MMNTFGQDSDIWGGLVAEPSPARFAQFYTFSYQRLFGYCCSILHNQELCEDVMQATYARLWEALSTGVLSTNAHEAARMDPHSDAGAGDGLQVLRRFADLEIDRQRKLFGRELRRRVDLTHARELRSNGLPQREVVVWSECVRTFDLVLAQLPVELATPFRLHYFEERSHREIALELRVDRSIVTKRIAKAVVLLRARVLEE
jgi:RNA polymerase sigma factor (sigma-70 family)